MRDDMKKVLVTTPRIGSRWKNDDVKQLRNKKPSEEGDNMPSRMGMKPRLKKYSDRKQLNEYLNPLIRYLTSNCGRPWDKVYSEIREKNPKGNAVSEHIYEHLFDYVCTNPIYKDNKVYVERWGSLQELYKPYSFYVDDYGILRQPRRSRPKRKQPKKDYIVVKDEAEGENIILIQRKSDKVWFMISYRKPVTRTHSYIDRAGTRREYKTMDKPGLVEIKNLDLPRIPGKYPCHSKTLSKKEKKKYGLN